MNIRDLVNIFAVEVPNTYDEMEVRIGDVVEGSDLHCSVGTIEMRGNCVVLTPGDDDVWKDETVASAQMSKQLWPEELDSED